MLVTIIEIEPPQLEIIPTVTVILEINVGGQGEMGPVGPQGPAGSVGPAGPQGTPGVSNNFTRTATATNYTVLITDHYVGITDLSVPRVMTLPLASSCYNGQPFVFKDETGNCNFTNYIRIAASGGDLIDGDPTQDLIIGRISIGLISDGVSKFFIV